MAGADVLRRGQTIGGVTIGPALGQGSFGITYRVRRGSDGRVLALKEYFPSGYARRTKAGRVVAREGAEDIFEAGLRSFLDEANILLALPRQRGLVRVRGAFKRSGTAYCLMDYVEGVPLDRMLDAYARAGRSIPADLLAGFIADLTHALGSVHDRGLIHRDIKPANVMIRRGDGQPVLIDFGASRRVTAEAAGVSMLTREYAPIEFFTVAPGSPGAALREGPWSDIFSLSVMLYRMLSGELPHDAEARMAERARSGNDPFSPLANHGAAEEYGGRVCELIDFGCALLPQDRPADAAGFGALFAQGRKVRRGAQHRGSRFGAPRDSSGSQPSRTEGGGDAGPDPALDPDPRPGSPRMARLGVAAIVLGGAAGALAAAAVSLGVFP